MLHYIGLFASLGVYLLVAVPLNGALVRLRANFNPKSLQLDAEGNAEPHTGPIVTSFFGMLARVKRIEVCALACALSVRPLMLSRDGRACTRASVCCVTAAQKE